MKTSNGVIDFHVDDATIIARYGKDNRHVGDAILSYLTLLDDSPLQYTHGLKPARLYRKFYCQLVDDFRGVVLQFAGLHHEIVSSTTLMGSGSITGDFVDAMRSTPIFKEYLEWYRTGNPHILTYISTFLLYCKKLDYVDESFDQTALRGWLANEEKLSRLILPDITQVKDVLAFLTDGFEFTNHYGKFGPGHVAERYVGVKGKSVNFALTPRLEYAYLKSFMGMRMERETLPSDRIDPDYRKNFCSRRRFARKDLRTSRTIHIEPNAAMFFQQMAASDLHRFFDERLSIFIDLADQSRNQAYSQFGSWSGAVDTIDLSSASDLVSIDLVRKIFPRRILYYLLASRSSVVTDGRTRTNIHKFAPMGSALCFPVQCLIFLSVSLVGYYQYRFGVSERIDPEKLNDLIYSLKGLDDDYDITRDLMRPLVYGDDIVTDSKVSTYVTQMLEQLGFLVNHKKSFYSGCAFRESCGGYHWNGFDITPLLYRGDAEWSATQISRYEAQVEHINALLEYGYYRTRHYHLKRVASTYPFPLMFSNADIPCAIRTHGQPYNPHLRCRYNKNLQRTEYRVVQPQRRKGETRLFEVRSPNLPVLHELERYGYMRWWDAARRRGVDSSPMKGKFARRDSYDSRPRWVWTPLR